MIQRELRWFKEAEATLAETVERFPTESDAYFEYARVAEARGDWAEAALRWELMRESFPDRAAGYVGGAAARRERGRMDEAEALTAEAAARFSTDAAAAAEQAGAELASGELRIADVAEPTQAALPQHSAPNPPDPPQPAAATAPSSGRSLADCLDSAVDLRNRGHFEEAEMVLAEAMERFPEEPRPCSEWALLAHVRRDWSEAARRWEALRKRFPDDALAFVLGGVAARQLGEFDDAEALLSIARERYPIDAGAATEYAWLATQRRDWPQALERWEVVRDLLPDQPGGYLGIGRILRETGQFAEAEAVVSGAIDRFPGEPSPLIEYAVIADARGDWEQSNERWNAMRAALPQFAVGVPSGARALRQLGRTEEADALLVEGIARFPEDPAIGSEYAWLAQTAREWHQAVSRWEEMRAHHPDLPVGYSVGGAALREPGRLAEA